MSCGNAVAVMRANGQRRSCRAKRNFENRPAAEAAIQAEAWRLIDEGVALRPYKCQCCPGWHLTSERPGSSRERHRRGGRAAGRRTIRG